jgi:hypothetical protein
MNPSSSETSGLSLPAPVPEQAPAGYTQPENQPAPAETAGGAERAPVARANQAPAAAVAPPMAMPVPAAATPEPVINPARPTVSQKALGDDDLIAKEWVERAKRIVEGTHDDPYKQTEEISVAKSDYLQKNYNKSLKLNK